MLQYEIRILKVPGSPSIIMLGTHLNDFAAVRSARKMALGRPFEVWRDLDCITGLARLSRPRIVKTANEAA
jgi:hypothetical protein